MERFNLVIQTAFIGDLLLTIPLLRHLRQIDPDAKIILLCRYGFGDFFIQQKLVDQVFEVRKGVGSNWKVVSAQLSQLHYTKIISPHMSFRTAHLVYKLKAKEKIGFKKMWNFFAYDKRVEWRKKHPEALRLLALIEDLDPKVKIMLSNLNQDYLKMTTEIPQEASLQIEPDTSSREKRLFLAPGSEWATKRWTIEGYTEVAKEFINRGYKVSIVGTKAESAMAEIIKDKVHGCENLCGKTSLLDLYNLFRRGQVLVSNDSGAMHMASVAGLPVVAVFGPTVLQFGYRPWTEKALVVEKELSCRPCGLHGSQICPLGTHDCMKSVGAQKVIDAVKTFL